MDMELKDKFTAKWRNYFRSAELPIIFYYADEVRDAEPVQTPTGHRCIMGELAKVRRRRPSDVTGVKGIWDLATS